MSFRLSGGTPYPLGATPDPRGTNFAIASANAERVELCLFDGSGETEIGRLRLPERNGDVWHGHVAEIGPGQRYGYRVYGPFDPSRGHRFNPHKLLIDPYAKAIDRQFHLAPSLYGHILGDPRGDLSFSTVDSAADMPKAIVVAPGASRALSGPRIAWPDTVIYELHAKGFSKRNESIPEALRGTLQGLAHPASLEYLTKLGVTTLEVMPLAAFIDERHLAPLNLRNYWGYNPVTFMAPDPRYYAGNTDDVAAAVEQIHAAGLEVIVDVVFNHSGESDELGPTICYRGIDNATYYRLQPDAPRLYDNVTGCGNTLAVDRPLMLRLVMDAMRHWVGAYGVDGFRFDLATTLARDQNGFQPNGQFLSALRQDPVLAQVKLIAEPWDLGPGGYRGGGFPPGIAEWNDRFRDEVRQFWAGGNNIAPLASRVSGSSDRFGWPGRTPSDSINHITAHDGFTLADLVSYAAKHNDANGEGNRDGTEQNHSWNHGIEGPSDDPAILAARRGDMRALLAILLLSRGTPMLRGGDELGQSQGGNNNSYAQDNATTWIDWAGSATKSDLTDFTRRLIALRRAHPALRANRFLQGVTSGDGWFRDAVWRRAEGGEIAGSAWQDPTHFLGLELSVEIDGTSDHVYLAINGGDQVQAVLPPTRGTWRVVLDSADPGSAEHLVGVTTTIAARSVMLLADDAKAPALDHPELLARLAQKAGIEPEHRDANGRDHVVSAETKRALLTAMRLPAGDGKAVRESLHRLETAPYRTTLQPFSVAAAGQALRLIVTVDADRAGRMLEAGIRLDNGDDTTIRIQPGTGRLVETLRIDGKQRERWDVATDLILPIGLHSATIGDGSATIAATPGGVFQAPLLAGDRRCWGVSTNLYSARSEADWGIGDFTTLREIGEAVAQRGGVLIGINPLHALFPDRPDRTSPYYPSDRRFLEAAYIDPHKVPGFTAFAAEDTWFEGAEREAARLRETKWIDYAAVFRLKRQALLRLWNRFREVQGSAYDSFRHFVAEGGTALRRFADHQAAHAERDADFHMFLQFFADHALGEAVAEARLPLGLYRDLAVGPAPDGAELEIERDVFATGVSVGAPPDAYSAEGQVWGVPSYDPLALAGAGYRPWVDLLRANMRHAGALRLDHVMGIERLLWVPEGATANDGAYVKFDAAAMMAILAVESHRQKCMVVGEDLGTVPSGFRERMEQAGLYTMRVALFERDNGRLRPPDQYPAHSVAAFGSHDLPPFHGWWKLHHGDSEGNGLRDAAGTKNEDADAASVGLHAWLGSSNSKLALVQVDDLAREETQINVPGTTERPNWRRRNSDTIDDIFAAPHAAAILDAIGKNRKAS